MKFKKVEISAFRIFDDPKDATFDLTTKSGEVADFVSLYAPNGFGKTSFYDAVEFGVTNSINRFFIRNRELEKLANFQLIQNEVPLIRNSKSGPNRKTYVKIITNNNSKPEIIRNFKKHGRQIHDLNFTKKPASHEFQKVILSQEWITAFLTEQNGEDRYEKFMNIPELSGINDYYIKLKQACSVHEQKKNKIKDDIIGFEKSINFVDSENLLDTINKQIQLLAEQYGEKSLTVLSLNSTQEEIKELKDIIAIKTIQSNRESELIQLLKYVDLAKSGNNLIIGLNSYFSILEANQKNEKRLLEIRPLLEKFRNLEKLGTEIENIKTTRQKHIDDKNRVIKVISGFSEYERILNDLQVKYGTISQMEINNEDTNKNLEELNRIEIELRGQFETVIKELEELANKKAKIPEMKKEYERLNDTIQKEEIELDKKTEQIEVKEKEQRELENIITGLRRIIEEITNGMYPQISKDENHEINELVEKLEKSEQLLSDEKGTVKSLETTIKQQKALNQTITDFIKAGLSIVDERQSSTCPLCEQNYESYNLLVKKITNNKALNETLKTLFAQKSKSELRIFELTTGLKEIREQLLNIYRQQLDKLSIKNQDEMQSLNSLKRNIKETEVELNNLRQRRGNQKIVLNGLSFDALEKQIDKNTKEADKIKTLLIPKLAKNKEAIEKSNEQINSFKNKIELLKKEIEELNKNEKYILVKDWFNEYFPGIKISRELLTQKDASLAEDIRQLVLIEKEIDEKVNNISKQLSSFKKENLLQEEVELKRLVQDNDVKINKYIYFLKDKLDIDSSQLNKTELLKIIEKKQAEFKIDLDRTKSLKEEYQKLEKYSDNLWPFLQSENAKLNLADAKKELDLLEQRVEPIIKKERDKAKAYLDDRIKNFFHEDLINKLYHKIDPHPDFKSVEFKADFNTENPRLDVFVRNIKNENTLIPNLYFSTAQINILSLSIFLATALNSKEYQCIFIDDPIQSLDSINVLSTIDLFRSIVVNEGKQVILSTHDENFHNLLKKKMPEGLFQSKFLELESFGKVKIDSN